MTTRFASAAGLAAALVMVQPAAALADDGPDKYAEHYDIGRNQGGGFFFDFRATPQIEAWGLRLHYENQALGQYVFSGMHFDRIPFIGGYPRFMIFPGKVGMLHVLPLGLSLGQGRLTAGIGVGDRVRIVRGDPNGQSDAEIAEVWSPAAGVMAELELPLPEHLTLRTSLELAAGTSGGLKLKHGVADEKLSGGALAFQELRGRLELQWGTVLSFGTLLDVSRGGADGDGPIAKGLGGNHHELTFFAGFRQPAIESSVKAIAGLFGGGDDLQSGSEKTHTFEGASTIQFNVLGGVNFVRTDPAEMTFARERARDIVGGDNFTMQRHGVDKRPNLGLWLSYFSPHHFYAGLGGHAILAQNELDTRFIVTSGRQQRVIDISRMAIGAGLKAGAHTTLLWGHMIAYGGIAGGISNYRYNISTYSCGVPQVAQTEPSDISVWCDGQQPDKLSNGSMKTGRWAQPHLGFIYSFETIGAEVESPGSEDTVYVGGGFYLYAQSEWDLFFGDDIKGTDGKPLKTADGRKLPLGLSGGSLLGGVGWAFRFGG